MLLSSRSPEKRSIAAEDGKIIVRPIEQRTTQEKKRSASITTDGNDVRVGVWRYALPMDLVFKLRMRQAGRLADSRPRARLEFSSAFPESPW